MEGMHRKPVGFEKLARVGHLALGPCRDILTSDCNLQAKNAEKATFRRGVQSRRRTARFV